MLPDCDGVAHAVVMVTIMVVMKEIKICVMKESCNYLIEIITQNYCKT